MPPSFHVLALVALVPLAPPAAVREADSSMADTLAPSTAPPWNPPRAVPAEKPWKTVVRFPLRVATSPIAFCGRELITRFAHPREMDRRHAVSPLSPSRLGIELSPARLGDETGLGLGARFVPPRLHHLLALDLEASTRQYLRTRAELRRGPVALDGAYAWRPRERFYGLGPRSSRLESSSFASREQRLLVQCTYPWRYPSPPRPTVSASAWAGPREMVLLRGRAAPSFDRVHPDAASLLDRRDEQFVYGARLARDARSGVPHWTDGWRAAIEVERFARAIASLSLHDASTRAPRFTRTTLEAETGFSFDRDPRTLRLAVRVVDQAREAGGGPLLLSDLASLGGDRGLAGYEPGRFRDRDGIVTRLGYLIPLSRYVECDLHAETGTVAPSLRGVRLADFRQSYGAGLRPRGDSHVFGSIGVDWSGESVWLRYSMGGVD